jgi:hypothetical protein
MANLELVEGAPDRPNIDGIISNTDAGLYTWAGIEYANFTEMKMYVQGNSETKPWVANGYIAYDCQNKILVREVHDIDN